MRSPARTALFWQIAGGVVAGMFILAFVAELLWWPLYLSDHANVTLAVTIAVHAFSAVAAIAFVAYVKSKDRRRAALQRAAVENFDAIALRLRVFGFDVDVQWLFLSVAIVLAVGSGGPAQFTVFAAAVAIVIVIHELGHALVARRLGGQNVRILLHSLGGLTQFSAPLSRRRTALVAIAGPATGFALSAAVAVLGRLWPAFHSMELYSDLLFITFGWSALNLLPILPLDGGVLLADLIDRQPLAALLSLSLATLGTAVAAALHSFGLALFFSVLVVSNLLAVPRVATTIARWNRRFD